MTRTAELLENPATTLCESLRSLAAAIATHPHRDRIAERLACYEVDADLTAESGHDVIDQTLGEVLRAMLRDDPNPWRALADRGILDDLRT